MGRVLDSLDPTGQFSIEGNLGQIASCIRSEIETGIRPNNPFPPKGSACNWRGLEIALDEQLIESFTDLTEDIMLTTIGPLLPGGIPGEISEEIAEEILDILTGGDPGVPIEDIVERIENILRDRILDDAGIGWPESKLISAAEAMAQLRLNQQAGESCGTVSLSGETGFGESSKCTLQVCGSLGIPGDSSGISFRVSGICNYKCDSSSSRQNCCCGDARSSTVSGTGAAGWGGGCSFSGKASKW